MGEIIIILTVVAVVCAAGWYTRYISYMAILYYIGRKGYEFPDEEEIRECTACVEKYLWRVRF